MAAHRSRPTLVDPKKVLQCGAGQTQFHIDAYGRLQPCLMLPGVFSDLTTTSLASAWDRIGWIREMNLGHDSPCTGCDKRVYCGYCPGLLGLESYGVSAVGHIPKGLPPLTLPDLSLVQEHGGAIGDPPRRFDIGAHLHQHELQRLKV